MKKGKKIVIFCAVLVSLLCLLVGAFSCLTDYQTQSFSVKCEIPQYNITYYSDGSKVSVVGDGVKWLSYNYGELPFTLPRFEDIGLSKQGYSFMGWCENEDLGGEIITSIPKYSKGDKTYYAKWKTYDYTITYDLMGGTATGNPASYTIETETFTLNNPTRAGYSFIGWTGSNGEIPDTSVSIEKGSMGDKSYTANWKLKPDVKYAVSIYGINQDSYEGGGSDKAGLTFGPATGASYISSYKSHTPSPGQMCMHDMTWDAIAAQSIKDPTVFQECMANGCTHAVELTLNSTIKGSFYPDMSGDGAGILYNSINLNYRRWNGQNSEIVDANAMYGSNAGGWPASRVRATLNGADALTDSILVNPDTTTGYAGNNYICNTDNCLFSCFPAELQSAIVAKAVKSDIVYNDLNGNNQTTYDKLWLFSGKEVYGDSGNNNSVIRPNEGTLYKRQSLMGITSRNYAGMKGYYEIGSASFWWLCSASPSGNVYAYSVSNSGDWYDDGVNSSYGLSPGFSLK